MIVHWADVTAKKLLEKDRRHKIATGITPSGHIHLGNLREMMTADAVKRAINDGEGEAEVVYIADTFDPLRRRYPFLPEEYDEYIGMPLNIIPDPEGCHDNYAEHFLAPFLESIKELDIEVTVERADEMYRDGRYVEEIKTALDKRDEIAQILHEITGREIGEDWYPFMPFCENCKRINASKVTGYDDEWVYYRCECGHEGKASYRGGGKLSWRVDWAARWKILAITCEPFGKDHATAGGSYDTGVRLAREIFGIEPPFPIIYEWIHLKGVGAMKSSKGIVVPVKDLVDTLPPELVRYIIIRSKPEKHIEFDPTNLLEVIEEFEDAYKKDERSIQLSMVSEAEYSDVPFKHILVVGQIAKWDSNSVLNILERTGYKIDETMRKDVERKIEFASKWIEKYAPDRLKFEITEEIPELEQEEKEFLKIFTDSLQEGMTADEIHTLVYETAKENNIKPKKAFGAIYKAILNKSSGPRVGYFLKSLGTDWVRSRFQKAYEEN
ncbi:MAG: lysine--tRNA ligase [Archaeoglobaceae archaeon]